MADSRGVTSVSDDPGFRRVAVRRCRRPRRGSGRRPLTRCFRSRRSPWIVLPTASKACRSIAAGLSSEGHVPAGLSGGYVSGRGYRLGLIGFQWGVMVASRSQWGFPA